ncbi:MAG: carbon storage regulator [Thermoguttaceae bacterium]|jgi:carbon storage regulator|nr:carbon storage regulator [Thermoguttaceae bacterium]MBQ2850189.1 carbon storage regulator [Thermoguttaceae bacterium]MBQ5789623.1 carbon storage regulator [Thermoguttaceae bacterium]MBQ7029512.1 carbon storage regulator [Thermoguttaceae bacterium]MBQ8285166.1 carbon storage regulator [Thermoguttaceae bacterium]
MLVLSRREGESVCVGGGVVVTVVRICGNKVRIGVAAENASILRAELREKDEAKNAAAAQTFEFEATLDDGALCVERPAA